MARTSAALLSALALTLSACDSGSTPVEPESSRTTPGNVLLEVQDLPDGVSPNGRAMAETGFVRGGSVRHRHGGSIVSKI